MAKPFNRTVTLFGIYKQLVPFIRPYRLMIYGTLFLTFLGALAAQVNPLVLKYTVDEVTKLTHLAHPMSEGIHILVVISVILLGKELLNIFINFGQKFYGEKIRINAKKLSGVRRTLRNQREQKTSGLLNLINSIMVIKSFVREKFEGKKQYDLQMQLMESQMFTRKTNFIYDGLKTFIEQFGVVLIILLTVYLVLDQQMTIGAIMLHIMLFNNVSAPIRQLHRIYDDMNDAMIYAEDDEKEPNGNFVEKDIKGNFELKNINFTYPNGTQALHDVSMKIENGKTTALVGLSGAGKSTIINLLCKFYLPDSGEIFLDGVDLNHFDNTFLRNDLGLVLQKNHIFQGRIEDNIRYGNMNATFEEIEEAAKKAYLHEQILDLPEKYNHDATQLSGGQQQRIAIARLFLKNPPIIFLDEPTASLDAIATEQIKNSLDAIKEGRTILDSDKIYVMKKGRVVESGTHDELVQINGTYREIFDASARSLNLDKLVNTYNDKR
ncbi:hypothetical protein Lal_00009509 [Lupinus albus]|nr:hypothetical protein Lal_00009509 [Lupinus albus]